MCRDAVSFGSLNICPTVSENKWLRGTIVDDVAASYDVISTKSIEKAFWHLDYLSCISTSTYFWLVSKGVVFLSKKLQYTLCGASLKNQIKIIWYGHIYPLDRSPSERR
jgi:hypothetical protein